MTPEKTNPHSSEFSWVDPAFSEVVMAMGDRLGRTFSEQLLYLAVMGAEHERLCLKTQDHKRTPKK